MNLMRHASLAVCMIAMTGTFAGAGEAPPASSKLALTLTLDKASYGLGDEAAAEVRLDNASDATAAVRELQLEARSLSFEIAYEGKPAFTYTVHRPNVFLNTHAGPFRVPLAPRKGLVTIVPLPLVHPGKVVVTAVYKGASVAGTPVRSDRVSAAVTADGGKDLVARIETVLPGQEAKSTIAIRLDAEAAPVHVMNVMALARQGFYERQTFFRVIADFAIQAGCPHGSGIGDPGYNIPNEHKPEQKHVRGAVSMNHPEGRPEGAGSQFFICVKDAPWLDLPGEKFTVFGKVVEGLDAVDAIASVETDPKTNRPVKGVVIERVSIGTK